MCFLKDCIVLEMLNMMKPEPAFAGQKTVSLLYLDGTDEMLSPTQIKDAANPDRIWTMATGATLDGTNFLFGDRSLRINTGYGVSAPHDASFLNNDEYTIEMFVHTLTAPAATQYFVCKAPATVISPSIRQGPSSNKVLVGLDSGSGAVGGTVSSPEPVFQGGWTHLALVVRGGEVSVFLGGSLVRRSTTASTAFKTSTAAWVIGSTVRRNSADTKGNFSAHSFRYSRVARYRNNFTPPTKQFVLD